MKYLIILIILGIIILAWCPWLTVSQALNIVDTEVAQVQKQNPDLCSQTVNRNSIKKVPFGYTEEVSYNCAINDPAYGVAQSTNIVFITFYKGLWGIPNETEQKNLNM
jgi:hypothetical protein